MKQIYSVVEILFLIDKEIDWYLVTLQMNRKPEIIVAKDKTLDITLKLMCY